MHFPSGMEHFSKRHLTILVLSCALVARAGGGCQNGAVVLVEKDPPSNKPAVAIPRPRARPVDVDANLLCTDCRKDGDDDDDDDGCLLALLISCGPSCFIDIIIPVFVDDETYMLVASPTGDRLKDVVVIWVEVKEYTSLH